jgi:hypothetical protein
MLSGIFSIRPSHLDAGGASVTRIASSTNPNLAQTRILIANGLSRRFDKLREDRLIHTWNYHARNRVFRPHHRREGM